MFALLVRQVQIQELHKPVQIEQNELCCLSRRDFCLSVTVTVANHGCLCVCVGRTGQIAVFSTTSRQLWRLASRVSGEARVNWLLGTGR